MSPEEAIADLQAKRDAIPAAMAEGRAALGSAAVARIQAEWPVGDGPGPHSRDAWAHDDTRGVYNDLPHTPYVHEGLADRLAPQVLSDLQSVYDEAVTAALDAAGRT